MLALVPVSPRKPLGFWNVAGVAIWLCPYTHNMAMLATLTFPSRISTLFLYHLSSFLDTLKYLSHVPEVLLPCLAVDDHTDRLLRNPPVHGLPDQYGAGRRRGLLAIQKV